MAARATDILSAFWAPLCAVGSHGPQGPNAQVCVSIFGASIVPERPRLLVVLHKTNLTHDLVAESGTLAVTAISPASATSFLVAVRDLTGLAGGEALGWQQAKSIVGEDFLARWAEKSARERAAAFDRMTWRD
jgi:flavin reductase (DIM6/NTAB) family NADH-FMN oxidoreductase RutF